MKNTVGMKNNGDLDKAEGRLAGLSPCARLPRISQLAARIFRTHRKTVAARRGSRHGSRRWGRDKDKQRAHFIWAGRGLPGHLLAATERGKGEVEKNERAILGRGTRPAPPHPPDEDIFIFPA